MINRPDFSKSIGTAEDIHSIFDEVMALYNIVADMYTSAQVSNKTDNSVTFEVIFADVEKTASVFSMINNQLTVIYEIPMNISCSVSNTTLSITLTRV
jgi:hypothetical protein